MDAGYLSTEVIVDRDSNGMELMDPVSIDGGCGKDDIVTEAINHRCSRQWPPFLPLMRNNDRWLLAVIVINCPAAAMMLLVTEIAVVIKGKATAKQLQGNDNATEMQMQSAITPAEERLIAQQQSAGVDEPDMMGTMGWMEETCLTCRQRQELPLQ